MGIQDIRLVLAARKSMMFCQCPIHSSLLVFALSKLPETGIAVTSTRSGTADCKVSVYRLYVCFVSRIALFRRGSVVRQADSSIAQAP
jgi:hypothetical protein